MSSRAAGVSCQHLLGREIRGSNRKLTASTDPLHGDTSELLNELDVRLCLRGKGVKGLDRGDGCLPALKLLVDNLESVKVVEVGGEVLDDLASLLVLVGDSNLDGRECVQDVELWRGIVSQLNTLVL